MLLPSILEPRARAFPEAKPAGLQCVAQDAFVCRHHWGDVVEHGDGLDDFLRGLQRLVLQVALVKFCKVLCLRDDNQDGLVRKSIEGVRWPTYDRQKRRPSRSSRS